MITDARLNELIQWTTVKDEDNLPPPETIAKLTQDIGEALVHYRDLRRGIVKP